jgi:hypothetical protein
MNTTQLIPLLIDGETAEQAHERLTAKSIAVRTPFFLTANQLILLLGPDAARDICRNLILAAQSDPLLDPIYKTLCNQGVDTSLDVTQQMIDKFMIQGLVTLPQATAIKATGLRWVSPLEQAGINDDVTLEDVTAAMAERDRLLSITLLDNASAARRNDEIGKIAWLRANPLEAVPADLAGLGAWQIPQPPVIEEP